MNRTLTTIAFIVFSWTIYCAPGPAYGCKVRIELRDGSTDEGYSFFSVYHDELWTAYRSECLNDSYITELLNSELKQFRLCQSIYRTQACTNGEFGVQCKTIAWSDVVAVFLYYVDESIKYDYFLPELTERQM